MWRRLVVYCEGDASVSGGNPSPGKVKVNQLPLYGDPSLPAVELLPEKVGTFRNGISSLRKEAWVFMDSIKETTDYFKDKYEIGKAHTSDALHYIQEDSGALPRAAIITVAGLGGIVAGFRGGALRKTFYASVGMATAASICYPHQAVDIVSGQWDNVRREVRQKWRETFSGDTKIPTIPIKRNLEKTAGLDKQAETTTELKDQSQKDKAAKVQNQSVAESKKDYGQSKPEDKDMYTTRGS